jgi:uncharacterized membrane protein YkoI
MKPRRSAVVFLWLAVCATGSGTLCAAPPPATPSVSMDQAVKMAEQRYHARVVKAQTEREGTRTVYALKLYNKSAGKVWTVHVDAADGSVL